MEQLTVGRIEFALADAQPLGKKLAELELRRRQMARFPFCPDHRDKVFGLACHQKLTQPVGADSTARKTPSPAERMTNGTG